jgi:hypothetical protein
MPIAATPFLQLDVVAVATNLTGEATVEPLPGELTVIPANAAELHAESRQHASTCKAGDLNLIVKLSRDLVCEVAFRDFGMA